MAQKTQAQLESQRLAQKKWRENNPEKWQKIRANEFAKRREKTPPSPGIIYIVGTGDINDPVKIGWTGRDMKRRLSEMQKENPNELKVLFTSKHLPNANKVEHKIHDNLKAAGKHLRGEWFTGMNRYQFDKLKKMLK